MNRIDSEVAVFSTDELRTVHDTSLIILASSGLRVPHQETRQRCAVHGAEVNNDTEVVRIPVDRMEAFIDSLQQRRLRPTTEPEDGRAAGFTADSTTGRSPSDGSGRRTAAVTLPRISGTISTQVHQVDLMTGTRRLGTMDFLKQALVVSDALPHIAASNAAVIPHDVPAAVSDILSFQAIYTYSSRPGSTYILTAATGKGIIEMSRVVGRTVPYLLESVSPLQFTPESLELAILFADAGFEIGVAPMVMAGASGPVTLAGTVALQNAESLGSLFVVEALGGRAGSGGYAAHTMDLRTGLCSFGSPAQALIGLASAQLGRFYGLPVNSNCALTDSLTADFQAGFEKAFTMVMSVIGGVTLIGAQGIVGADQGFSLEQLVIDDAWLGAYNSITGGVSVTPETLALEVIQRVGIGGNVLADEHTLRHMRDGLFESPLFPRNNWDGWVQSGKKNATVLASERVREILERGCPRESVIAPEQRREIDRIVASTVKAVVGDVTT